MRPITISELKDIAAYELERKTWRPLVMALKDRRRIRVGEHLTFLFENRETVRYQIQEMMRIERIVEPEAIRHEVETYNELIPGDNELSASLLIEYDSPEERSVRLRELLGLENHVWLVAGGESARARFDTRQIATDRISSVQYIKFRLSPEQAARWREGARLAADHPQYRAEHELTPEEIDELARDLG
ncbi:MAG: DUF3501 family protein [Acidobacteriota bacterium]